MTDCKKLIDKLKSTNSLSADEFVYLIENRSAETDKYLYSLSRTVTDSIYGRKVYIRGLIEFTNYCRRDCLYCGIRRSNKNAERYRLTREDILECCKQGFELGFRTFVLQGGEDGYFTDDIICDIVRGIKEKYPDCAVTLSIGEKSGESYKKFREAGADRYLLRHETADREHYSKLHPPSMSCDGRKECLYALKKAGFQTGSGFMVGSPFQTSRTLAEDMLFLKELQPHMVGIGPFIPHHDTPFGSYPSGSADLTVFFIALIRLMLPFALIPATTSLGTSDPMGREKGILAGANVIMPNLSPLSVRKKYMLYDNKLCTGDEAAEHLKELKERMRRVGCEISAGRGDCKGDY